MLRPWSPGELFANDGEWEAEAVLGALLHRLGDGAAPTELVQMLEQVGGTYTPL
jgi:hypothetical protein